MAKQVNGRSQEDIDDAAEQSMLAAAIGFTEREIFDEAMANPEDENDGDRSLEEMGEGHDDEPVDEETGEELEAQGDFVDPASMEEVDPITGQPVGSEDADATEAGAGTRDSLPPQGDQPSWLRASDQQISPELVNLRERLARAEGMLAARAPASAPGEPPAKPVAPDPVVDLEGFYRHQNEQIAAIRDQIRNEMQVEQRRERLISSFNNWENNYREAGREQELYFASGVLDRMAQTGNPGDVRIVNAIVGSPDPARALMQWAENNLDMDSVRQQVDAQENERLAQLLERRGIDPDTVLEGRRQASDRQLDRGQQRRDPGARGGQNGRQQSPRSRLPSLNSAAGGGGRMGGNSRNLDPRGFDGSESSIFDFAMTN